MAPRASARCTLLALRPPSLTRFCPRSCFRCALCGERILEPTFAYTPGGAEPAQPCHAACHRAAHHPRCAVCHDFIPAQPDGSIRYNVTPVWEERWCPAHAADGTRRCCGCERLEPRAAHAAHASLPDGRALCVACVPGAVVDEADAAPLYADVAAFYESLGVPLPARPPLRLVDAGVLAALASRADAPPHEGAVGDAALMLRGVTLSETVVLRPVLRGGGAVAAALWGLRPEESLPRVAGTRVTCIALLSAMPRLLSGAVLAHEACHALLRLSPGVPHPLRPRVEEGLCQLLGLLWLEREAAALSEPRAVAHAAQLAHAIRNDASDVYGGGVRDALAAYQAHGLAAVLDAVRTTGQLPRA